MPTYMQNTDIILIIPLLRTDSLNLLTDAVYADLLPTDRTRVSCKTTVHLATHHPRHFGTPQTIRPPRAIARSQRKRQVRQHHTLCGQSSQFAALTYTTY